VGWLDQLGGAEVDYPETLRVYQDIVRLEVEVEHVQFVYLDHCFEDVFEVLKELGLVHPAQEYLPSF